MEQYSCPWAHCSKAYKKQADLERHERIHTGELKYTCITCGKRFARSDVLSRHLVQRHGSQSPAIGRPRKAACVACALARVKCDGVAPSPCPRCAASQQPCEYRKPAGRRRDRQQSGTPTPAPTSTVIPSTPLRPTSPTVGAGPIEEAPAASQQLETGSPSVGVDVEYSERLPQEVMGADFIAAPHAAANELLMLASTASRDDDPLSFLNLDIPMQGVYDWGFGDPDMNIFEPLHTDNLIVNMDVGPVLPPPWFPEGIPSVTSDPAETIGTVATEAESLQGSPQEIPDGQPHDSPWPHIYKPKTRDASVRIPFVAPTAAAQPLFTFVPPSDQIPEPSRTTMMRLIEHSHHGIWPTVDIGSFPSVQTLTTCANLYLRHFHDWLPILDKGTFRLDQAPSLLLMSMAAIGSMYSQDPMQKLGIPLNELVRRGVLFIRENDHRFMFETNLIQASLLQSYYGMFCGSQELFQQSELNRGMLITACKRMHLLRPGLSAVEQVRRRTPSPTAQDMEAAIAEDERRRRLGWGIYLFDAQLGCLLNLPAQLSLTDITAPLPASALCPSSTTPFSGQGDSPSSISPTDPLLFSRVLETLLSEGRMSQPLSDLGNSIVAHTLYRLCLDAAAVQSLFQTSRPPTRYGLSFPSHVKHNPQKLLDQLASYTFHSSASPTPLLLSCAALAYHSHLQFTHVNFLERVKVAAGKSGTVASRDSARLKLSELLNENAVATRNIFAHAAMLRCLLWRFTFDTPLEVLWTFDAALCLWAVLRFGTTLAWDSIGGASGTVISWSESPAIEEWINYGGPVSIQGLGTLSTSTALQTFADRLDVLPWGLAVRYRKVLLSLAREDASAAEAH